jgi:dynein heavy chain
MITIPKHDFPEQFSNFCFYSLYIKEEVIESMTEIKEECNKVINDLNIFNTTVNKTMRLEEFRQIQGSMISQTQFYLKNTWTNNIQIIIEKSFSNVGKGWFNMNETSKET